MISVYDASVPVFARALRNMSAWLDKAESSGADEARLMAARLAPDMRPFPFQFQTASDGAKGAIARLSGAEAPSMADDEASFADLKARLEKTIAYIESVPREAFEGAAERRVELRFPNGMGYGFTGMEFLTGFALPNFFFHVTTAYALMRADGVPLGKPDFLQHLGAPNLQPA